MAGRCIGHGEPQVTEEDNMKRGALKLRQVIGYNGQVLRGLCVHPDGQYFVYPVGCNIVLERMSKKGVGQQEFLSKHSGLITALCVSPDGRFIASGESAFYEKGHVILWEFCTRKVLMHLPAHKMVVTDLVFMSGSHFFVSLGGAEDRMVTVWSSILAKPKVTHLAQPGRAETARCVAPSKLDEFKFVTGGRAVGRVWTISVDGEKLDFMDLKFAKHLHDIVCIEVADYDCLTNQMAFCGTSSGDIMIFSMVNGNLQAVVPKKILPHGVTCITYLRMLEDKTFSLLVGTGEGKVINYNITLSTNKANRCDAVAKVAPGTKPWSSVAEVKAITSISKLGAGLTFYIGSASNHMYEFSLHTFEAQLIRTCSNTPIYALAFARGTDDILVTGEKGRVRVFNLQVNTEARRYDRVDRTCLSLALNHDGTNIFTGWDNGETIVLGFEPKCLTLKELYRIDCAQKQPVNTIALTSDTSGLVTGGADGQTRVWKLVDDVDYTGRRMRQGLLLKQLTYQSGPVLTVQISHDDQRVLCASEDGSAVVYDLESGRKLMSMRCGSPMAAAVWCMGDLQVLTCGSDGFLRLWEVSDGSMLREHAGCRLGGLHTVNVRGSRCPMMANMAATGGDDTLVKLWSIKDGFVTHEGRGHSMAVLRSKFGPCGSLLVTSANDGSICVWDMADLD